MELLERLIFAPLDDEFDPAFDGLTRIIQNPRRHGKSRATRILADIANAPQPEPPAGNRAERRRQLAMQRKSR